MSRRRTLPTSAAFRSSPIRRPQGSRCSSGAGPASSCPPPDAPGRVGWHELLAADWEQAWAFYGDLFGWQKEDAEIGETGTYQPFSAGGQMIGGMFTKHRDDPGSLLALLFQRRRHRRDGAARQGRRRPDPGRSDRSRRAAAGSSDARTRRVRYSRWRGRGEAARSDISSAPHRAVLPARQAGSGPGRDRAAVSRKPPVARRDQAQIDRPGPRRGIRSRSSSRTDRYWCFRSRSRRAPCRLPSGRAFESIRRRPSG